MATTITKLFRTGILQSSVEFDEITYTTVKFATDGVYASEFDEVTMDGTASGGSLGTFTEIASPVPTGLYPLKIVIDFAGKFLYAAMQGDRTIIQYEIDQVSGELTQIGSPVSLPSAPAAPADIGIDPTGRFLYVTNSQLNLIRQFSINQTTGTLTQISSDISTNAWPFEMAFDLEGKYVYICNLFSNNISQYIINQTTGLLTKYADWSTTSNPRDITIDPTGKFLYVAQGGEGTVRQFSINQANGELTQITTDIPSGNTPVAITVSPSGQFAYAVNFADSPATISQYSINQSTGALSFIANIAVGGVNTETSPTEFIIDPTGSFGYVPRAGTPFGIKVFSINQTTGTLTLVYDFYNPVIPVNFYSFNAAIHPTGQFLYATLSPDGLADFPHGITQYKIDFSTSTSAVAERRTRDGKLLVSGYFDEVDINNPTPTPSEPIIGEPYGGGYYVGVIVQGGEKYRVIVAPKATGETSPVEFNGLLTAGAPATKTLNNGPAASAAWAAAGEQFDAATFCENLNISGYTDWYLPSRDELELCYRNLKPTTAINFDFGNRPKSSYVYPEGDDVSGEKIGRNRNSDPEGADYVSSNTLQTSVEIFKSGESEAFNGVESGVDYYHYYWSSSEYASEYCWAQSFSDGYQAGSQKQVFHSVRAVRRELISVITAVIPSTLFNIDRDQPYTVTFSVTGGTAPYTFSVITGSLPPGLNLSTLGTLSGTPTLAGTYNFTIRVVDSETNFIQRAYSLVVEAPIEITPSTLSNFIAGQSYSEVLTATGGDPDYTFTVDSGELPTGIILEPTGNLVGIPYLSSLIISPQDLPDAVNGLFYDERITASDGISPYVYSLDSGSLPTGLTLSSTGILQGLVQVETPNLTLVPSTLEDAINNLSYTVTLSATGGVIPYAFNIESGILPPNLILNVNGTISGTVVDNLLLSPSSLPDTGNGGSYSATITASNGEPPYTFAISSGSLPLELTMDINGNITGTFPVIESAGEEVFTTAGTYTWTAPAGVTSVSVVAVGAGGYNAGTDLGSVGVGGGGGGALVYKNNITVTPGQSYTVVVGNPPNGGNGGDSSFTAGFGTMTAGGGRGNAVFYTPAPAGGVGGLPSGIYDAGYAGGAGGSYSSGTGYGGGGGAGGYSGVGGAGGSNNASGSNGSGGGGGGGGSSSGQGGSLGGGVGILGQGSDGIGGAGGGDGSLGEGPGGAGSNGSGVQYGGGGTGWNGGFSALGGRGAVRIIWGAGRSFPNNAA